MNTTVINKAIALDGINDYVQIPHDNGLEFGTNSFTVEAYIYKEPNSPVDWRNIVTKKSTGGTVPGWVLRLNADNRAAWFLGDGTNRIDLASTQPLNAGQWYHLAGVVDRQNHQAKLYVDGVLQDTASLANFGSIDSGVDAFLGAWSDSLNGDRWHGKIDDVRIWNTARTATQIQNNTNTQLTGNEAGLVANYSFDDGTTRDLTGNHHGTAHGVVLRTPSPSLSFDGVNDYVQTQDPFQNNENFTISLWVNPQVINDGSFHGFIGKQDGLRKPSMWVSPHNGALHYWTNGNTATNIGDQIYSGFINNFFTAANEWVHVTWVKDGSQYRFYRNGDLVHTGAAPARVYTNPNTSYQFGSVGNYFQGNLDDISIWDRALTNTEIKNNANTPLTGNEAGLVANYTFDDGTANDLTGNHHGITHGFVLRTPSPSLSLDGVDDYVEIPHSETVNFGTNDNFTVEVWVKADPNQLDLDNGDNDIIEKWDVNGGGYPFVIRYIRNTGQIIAARWDGSNAGAVTSTTNINDGNFHHIAFVKDGENLHLYVDGVLESTQTDNTSFNTKNNSSIYVGRRGQNQPFDNHFRGEVDELRIWNTARTQAEIQGNANQKLTGNEKKRISCLLSL